MSFLDGLTVVGSLFGLLAALVGIVTLTAILYYRLKTKDQGYPNEAIIEAAILPYVYRAILGAYKASEAVADATGDRLHGIDKAKVAAGVWAVIPDDLVVNIVGYRLVIPVKRLLTEEQFALLVDKAFTGFEVWFEQTFQKWGDLVLDKIGEEEAEG